MIYQVILSDAANRDLRNIFEYIFYELKAPQSASGMLDKLEKAVLSLEEMPNRHRIIEREPWLSRKVRLMPVGNYVVIYFVDDNKYEVNIMRIIYGGRDIDSSTLEMLSLFVNNNPYNFEMFIIATYRNPNDVDIDNMIKSFESADLVLRNDITDIALFNEIGSRRFNSTAFAGPDSVEIIFNELFWFPEVADLEKLGYVTYPFGKKHQIFISHSSKEKYEVEKVISYLNGQSFPVWFDKCNISVGDSILDKISKGLNDSNIALFWITNNFLLSDWCNEEMKRCESLLHNGVNLKIISVIDREVKVGCIPDFLKKYRYIERRDRNLMDVVSEILKIIKV